MAARCSLGLIAGHGPRTTGICHRNWREYVSSSFGVVRCIVPDEETVVAFGRPQTQREGEYHPLVAPVNALRTNGRISDIY